MKPEKRRDLQKSCLCQFEKWTTACKRKSIRQRGGEIDLLWGTPRVSKPVGKRGGGKACRGVVTAHQGDSRRRKDHCLALIRKSKRKKKRVRDGNRQSTTRAYQESHRARGKTTFSKDREEGKRKGKEPPLAQKSATVYLRIEDVESSLGKDANSPRPSLKDRERF